MEKLNKIINQFETEKKKDIFLVANAVKYTEKMNYYCIEHAMDNEFFSTSELGEIVSSLFKTGSFVSIFYTETDFIKYVLENYSHLDTENLIIYNLARDGQKEGKKSLIPSFCDLFSLQYTGSNAFVISLCRNKAAWSAIASHYHIDTPDFFQFKYEEQRVIGNHEKLIGKRVIVKNTYESASIGMEERNIFNFTTLDQICEIVNRNKNDILIEEFIDGYECEVPFFRVHNDIIVLDPVYIDMKDSPIITSEISDAYDYSFQFLSEILPCDLCERLKIIVEQFAYILDLNTYGRMDFRITKDGKFYMIDIAATPYTIEHSSINYAFKKYGLKHEDIYRIILYATINKNLCVGDR